MSSDKVDEKQARLLSQLLTCRIRSLDISSQEDTIIFSTDTKQLIKLSINMENKTDDIKYEHLLFQFHSRSVDGMDVCIKKNLVATCSMDKTVKIWSYSSAQGLQLEINQSFNDEAFCIAFHPSGFHVVVGFADGIRMMNIFKKSLDTFKTITSVKNCREICFSLR